MALVFLAAQETTAENQGGQGEVGSVKNEEGADQRLGSCHLKGVVRGGTRDFVPAVSHLDASLLSDMLGKYFFPVCGLAFHFLDGIICSTNVFNLDEVRVM